jgi:hypothetical protein
MLNNFYLWLCITVKLKSLTLRDKQNFWEEDVGWSKTEEVRGWRKLQNEEHMRNYQKICEGKIPLGRPGRSKRMKKAAKWGTYEKLLENMWR